MRASTKRTAPHRPPSGQRGTPSTVLDIDALPPAALCTTRELAALTGFAVITLKVWRRDGAKGPKFVMIEGRPRYRACDVRDWLSSANCAG